MPDRPASRATTFLTNNRTDPSQPVITVGAADARHSRSRAMAQNDEVRPTSTPTSSGEVAQSQGAANGDHEKVLDHNASLDVEHPEHVGLHPHAHASGHEIGRAHV
jgi:hypothetical protein